MRKNKNTVSRSARVRKVVRRIACGVFVVYCLILVKLLLLRTPYLYYENASWLSNLGQRINVIPFRSILEYVEMWKKDSINPELVFINLLGNLLLFFPMGMFLPTLWKKARSFGQTVSIIGIIVLAVEILQAVLMVGSFDVDDLMMNISGGMLGYLIWRLPPIQKFLRFCGLSEDPAEEAEKQ